MKRLACLLLLAACPHKDPNRKVEPTGKHDAAPVAADAAIALPPAPPLPAVPAGLPPLPDAAITPDAVALGELLFFDARLSEQGAIACATCHDPAHGFSGGLAPAADGKPNAHRTPALVNLAWAQAFGWDGRYQSVADMLPVHVRGQQGGSLDGAMRKLAELPLYRAHLARVGGAPADAATRALAAYALTRYAGDSPWDRLEPVTRTHPGAKPDPITAGYVLFTGKARCATCHPPPLYTDGAYHRTGHNPTRDPGRGRVDPAQTGAFKTPTLRGAAARTAFFHDGAPTTLEGAVAAYAEVSHDPALVDPALFDLRLSAAEQASLIAFLRALTADGPPPAPPTLP